MSFRARFPGRCGVCQNTIDEGDSCDYLDDEVVHAKCVFGDLIDGGKEQRARVREAMCSECFTVHAGECL